MGPSGYANSSSSAPWHSDGGACGLFAHMSIHMAHTLKLLETLKGPGYHTALPLQQTNYISSSFVCAWSDRKPTLSSPQQQSFV